MALTEVTVARNRERMLSSELPAGQRLFRETQFNLSRNSVREAIKAFELIRVLDVRRGDGTGRCRFPANSAIAAWNPKS